MLNTISTGDPIPSLFPLNLFFTSSLLCYRITWPCTVTCCLRAMCVSLLHPFKMNSQLLFLTQHRLFLRGSLPPLHLFLLLLGSLLSLLFLHVPEEAQVLLRVRDLGQRQLEDLFGFRGEVEECEGGETERPGASGQAELMAIKGPRLDTRVHLERLGLLIWRNLLSTWRWRWPSPGTHRRKLGKRHCVRHCSCH